MNIRSFLLLTFAQLITQNESLGYCVALIGFVGYNLSQAKYFDTLTCNVCNLLVSGGGKEKVKKFENIPESTSTSSLPVSAGDSQA